METLWIIAISTELYALQRRCLLAPWVLAGTWAFRLNKTAWDKWAPETASLSEEECSATVSPWSHQQ